MSPVSRSQKQSDDSAENGVKLTDATFRVLGMIVIVALICYTVLAIVGSSGLDTMRDVLLGLVSGVVGGYAIARGRLKG